MRVTYSPYCSSTEFCDHVSDVYAARVGSIDGAAAFSAEHKRFVPLESMVRTQVFVRLHTFFSPPDLPKIRCTGIRCVVT